MEYDEDEQPDPNMKGCKYCDEGGHPLGVTGWGHGLSGDQDGYEVKELKNTEDKEAEEVEKNVKGGEGGRIMR